MYGLEAEARKLAKLLNKCFARSTALRSPSYQAWSGRHLHSGQSLLDAPGALPGSPPAGPHGLARKFESAHPWTQIAVPLVDVGIPAFFQDQVRDCLIPVLNPRWHSHGNTFGDALGFVGPEPKQKKVEQGYIQICTTMCTPKTICECGQGNPRLICSNWVAPQLISQPQETIVRHCSSVVRLTIERVKGPNPNNLQS